MAELVPIPFAHLLRRCMEERARHRAIFDLPERLFWRGDPSLDTGVTFQGRPAGTPAGPASGPQTQLAPNIVLSWLAGGRILELKTVQANDRLAIPRPCIHVPNVGYNVEWSQELRIPQSLREYVAASMLIQILEAEGVLGLPPGDPRGAFQLDVSLGYDLAGIRSARVRAFLEGMKDAREEVEALRAQIPGEHARLRDLPFRTDLAHNVTLSTFHGCRQEEVEDIARFLLREMGVDVCIKLNPTLLGLDRTEWLLREKLGYSDLRPDPAAFERDNGLDATIAMVRRLREGAPGRHVAVKMTNTLAVLNPDGHLGERTVYLSGQPLHVLALQLVDLWRSRVGNDVPISFSAGVDSQNFSDLVAAGLAPVTTCTDLLRPGGYGRLPAYLVLLEKRMRSLGVRNVPDYVIKAGGHGRRALEGAFARIEEGLGQDAAECPPEPLAWARSSVKELFTALSAELELPQTDLQPILDEGLKRARNLLAPWKGTPAIERHLHALAGVRLAARHLAAVLCTPDLARAALRDPRYAFGRNREVPRRVDRRLALFDCITCDKCISVCPNDANFAFPVPPAAATAATLIVRNGRAVEATARTFRITKPHQIACFADACNECGNCDTHCPEEGAPYLAKPHMFGTREGWERASDRDGFLISRRDGVWEVLGRIRGETYSLVVPSGGRTARFGDGSVSCEIEGLEGSPGRVEVAPGTADGHVLDLGWYCAMRVLLDGMRDSSAVHWVNVGWA